MMKSKRTSMQNLKMMERQLKKKQGYKKQALQLNYKACDSGIRDILRGIGDVFHDIAWLAV